MNRRWSYLAAQHGPVPMGVCLGDFASAGHATSAAGGPDQIATLGDWLVTQPRRPTALRRQRRVGERDVSVRARPTRPARDRTARSQWASCRCYLTLRRSTLPTAVPAVLAAGNVTVAADRSSPVVIATSATAGKPRGASNVRIHWRSNAEGQAAKSLTRSVVAVRSASPPASATTCEHVVGCMSTYDVDNRVGSRDCLSELFDRRTTFVRSVGVDDDHSGPRGRLREFFPARRARPPPSSTECLRGAVH